MVSDLNLAVHFYTETLGLKLKNRFGDEWAEVEAPGLTIGLHPAGEHGPKPGKSESLSIGLNVENLETAMAELKDKGVNFSPHIIEDGMLRISFFSDPDKNPFYRVPLRPALPAMFISYPSIRLRELSYFAHSPNFRYSCGS